MRARLMGFLKDDPSQTTFRRLVLLLFLAASALTCAHLAYILNTNSKKVNLANPIPPPLRTAKRVICTLARNEARFIKEWVQFHHLVGFTNLVIYDDASTDHLRATVASLPDEWGAEYHLVDWEYAKQGTHVQGGLQHEVMFRCMDRFWPHAASITFIDVDEFVYPCRSAWGPNSDMAAIWETAEKQIAAKIVLQRKQPRLRAECPIKNPLRPSAHAPYAQRMACVRFGLNGHERAHNKSVVESYTRRASYEHLSFRLQSNDSVRIAKVFGDDATRQACYGQRAQDPNFCNRYLGLTKVMWFPNASALHRYFPQEHSKDHPPPLWVHPNDSQAHWRAERFFRASMHKGLAIKDKNCNETARYNWHANTMKHVLGDSVVREGVCCNHVKFRSLEEMVPKLIRNQNWRTYNLSQLRTLRMDSKVLAFWERVEDRDALELVQGQMMTG